MGGSGDDRAGGKAEKRCGTYVCIASGPSLEDWQCRHVESRDCEIVAVNTSFRAVSRGIVYGCDEDWWKIYHGEVDREGWTASVEAAQKYGLNYIRGKNGEGLCPEPHAIHYGKNSGYQAIGLAYNFGAERIILIGYDMQHTGGRVHWHGRHPRQLRNAEGILGWVKPFGALAKDLEAAGVEVVNCTIETALDCFRRSDLEDVI